MTLIEVLAALLLMGSMLVALISARGKLLVQHTRAGDKQDAVCIADELLASWWATDPPTVPTMGYGTIETHDGWAWTVTEVTGASPDELDVRVIRLSIVDERDPTNTRVLTQIDVVVPEASPTGPARVEASR